MGASFEQHGESKAARRTMMFFAVVGGIAMVWVLNGWLTDLGSRHGPGTVWPIAVALCGPLAAVIAWKSWRESDLWVPGPLIPVVLVLYFGVLQGAVAGGTAYEKGTVAEYCKYGAVSRAQLDTCREHVTEADVDRLNTNAARFARTELESCLEDAGPYCEGVVRSRAYDDQRPGPNE